MTSRYWLATEFNYGSDAQEYLQLRAEHGAVLGVTGQLERTAEGRLHVQFAVRLRANRKPGWVKKHLSGTAHWEIAKDVSAAVDYCSKPESRVEGPWSFGSWELHQGARTDLAAVQSALDGGCSLRDIAEQHFIQFCRYGRAFREYLLLRSKPRCWEMEVIILWGKTGSGKTRSVYDRAAQDDLSVFALPQNDGGVPWFDGYTGEDVILIDDFYGWLKVSWLLKLLDRYPMHVQTKGGTVPFVSRIVYFTSNKDPRDWYDWSKFGNEVKDAFFRRVSKIIKFDSIY